MLAPYFCWGYEVDGINYSTSTDADGQAYAIVTKGSYAGIVTIPQSIIVDNKEIPIKAIGDEAFKDCTDMKAVSLPSSITSIGISSFEGCMNLKSIVLPENLKTIGSKAFCKCYSITTMEIPESVDSIGDKAFCSCVSLASTTLPSGLKRLAKSIFYGCAALSSIDIPEGLEYIEEAALDSCPQLTSLHLPSSLKDFPQEFYLSRHLSKIDITSENDIFFSENSVLYRKYNQEWHIYFIPYALQELAISNRVTEISYRDIQAGHLSFTSVSIPSSVVSVTEQAFKYSNSLQKVQINADLKTIPNECFYDCSNLVEINLPSSLEAIGYSAFSDCSKLQVLNIPTTVTQIGNNAFMGCSALATLNIPSSLTTLESNVFNRCSSLKAITIPKNIKVINDYCFNGCSSLATVVFECDDISLGNNVFSGCAIETITLPATIQKVGEGLFENCASLKKVVLPSNMIEIPQYLFYGCESLENVDISENIKQVGSYAFAYCKSISSLDFSGTSATLGERVFYGCENMSEVKLPKQLQTINDYLFENCKKLKNIDIPKSVIQIKSHAFEGSGLEELNMPENLLSIGAAAFYNCSKLKKLNLPEGIEAIEDDCFYNCLSLNEITLPSNVSSIGNRAFFNCQNLTSLTIPSKVKSLKPETFFGCKKLESIELPENITEIPTRTFYGCSSLKNVVIPSTATATEGLNIASTVTSIGEEAFACCGFKNLIIPESIEWLEKRTFANCDSLIEITIKENFKGDEAAKEWGDPEISYMDIKLSDGAFYGCKNLSVVKSYAKEEPKMFFALNNWQVFPIILIPKGSSNNYIEWRQGIETVYDWGTTIESDDYDAYKYVYDNGFVYHIVGDNQVEIAKGPYREKGVDWDIPSSVNKDNEKYYVVGITDYGMHNTYTAAIYLPDSLQYVGHYAFCNYDEEVHIKGDFPKNLKDFHFEGVTFDDTIHIPSGVTKIDKLAFSIIYNPTTFSNGIVLNNEMEEIGREAFEFANSKYLDFGLAKLESTNIYDAFNSFTGLRKVIVPNDNQRFCTVDGVLYSKDMTELLLYPQKKNVDEFTVPNGVKKIEARFINHTEESATKGMEEYNLSKLILPATVNSITAGSKVETVYCSASIPPVLPDGQYYEGTTLHVPMGTQNDYISSKSWKFTNIVADIDTGIDSIVFNEKVSTFDIFSIDGTLIKRGASKNDMETLKSGLYILKSKGQTKKLLK